MKKLLLILTFCALAFNANAQSYNWALGVRGGGTDTGLTFKHILSDDNAIEAEFNYWYLGNNDKGKALTVLYEFNSPIFDEGFTFYYGLGAHFGIVDRKEDGERTSLMRIGVDAVCGLEYKLANAPIAFSFDYRPFVNIPQMKESYFYNFGLGLKFAF